MKRIQTILFVMLFLSGIAMVPSTFMETKSSTISTPDDSASQQVIQDYIESAFIEREIRVAIYDESNVTIPDYSSANLLTNNISEVIALLEGAGYTVDTITEADILDYQLTLANYDVFVMVNNLPRETIFDLVKEFWLGGGGVLSFNSGMSYLYTAGMMLPELEVDPRPIYWNYLSHDIMKVTNIHPVSQDYSFNQSISERANDWATFYVPVWNVYSSKIEGDQTVLLSNFTQPDWGLACAIDSSYRGGKVVQLPGDGYLIPTAFESMIIESIDYLAPRPKARIAYDFSHQPRLCVDLWDEFTGSHSVDNSFSELRNAYVNHSYTFDKFYPSSVGNFTTERLANYDMLVIDWPELNFTEAERNALMEWIDAGGSLLLLGDRTNLGGDGNDYINFLIEELDMTLGTSDILNTQTATLSDPIHPSTEGCSGLTISNRNYLLISGAAQAIWEYLGNIVVAGQQYGNGRAVLFSDMNILDNARLWLSATNELFAINVADWLTASNADILYMNNYPYVGPPLAHYSYPHNSPAAEAMNLLGLEYQIVYGGNWLNRSLHWYDWDLVIIDSPWPLGSFYNDVADYVETGSYLLMSYHFAYSEPSSRLWPLLGFQTESAPFYVPTTIYIWDDGQTIFNDPVDYGASYVAGGRDYGVTGEPVTVFENATALAGFNQTALPGNASIVLGNEGRTLYNSYLIDQYSEDTDESGYSDNFELWLNQIALMTAAWIDQPADFTHEADATNAHAINWNPTSYLPASYSISIDSVVEDSGSWDGSPISFDFIETDVGVFEIILTCTNELGLSSSDTVIATVVDTTSPNLSEPFDFEVAQGAPAVIEWTATELHPDNYTLYLNGTIEDTGTWDGVSLEITLEGLEIGVYNVTVVFEDEYGNVATDRVWVTVTAAGFDLTLILLIAGVAAVLVIGAVVCSRRRAAGAATKVKPKPKKKK